MSTMITRLLTANKTETTSGAVPGTIPANSVGIYTSALTSKNSVSIKARVKQLFDTLRDNNHIADNNTTTVYATVNIDGGIPVIESSFIGMAAGDVRIGIDAALVASGSGILERAFVEMLDWGNENNKLVNG